MDIVEYIECSCKTELLQLTYEKESEQLFIAFYQYGHHNPVSLKQKLSCIKRILTTGKPYDDCVILEKVQIEKLEKFLKKIKGEKNG